MKPTIRAAREAIDAVYREIAREPDVVAARKAYNDAEAAAKLRFKPRLDAATADLHSAQRKNQPPKPYPALLVPVIDRLCRGVDWSAKFRVHELNSEYNRAIISRPSRTFFGGIGMRARAPVEYWLIDIAKAMPPHQPLTGLALKHAICIKEHTGRMPAEVRAQWSRFCNGQRLLPKQL